MMAWTTPKTDWAVITDSDGNFTGDYFEIGDYNRIKANIEYLYALAIKVYFAFSFDAVGSDKTVSDYPYADEINLLTSDLDKINAGTYNMDIGTRVIYADNGAYLTYTDLNRIESACLSLYTNLMNEIRCKRRLPIRLGGGKIRC